MSFPTQAKRCRGAAHPGDEDLLRYLFGILAHLFEGHSVALAVKDKGTRYVEIDLELPHVVYTTSSVESCLHPTNAQLTVLPV